jgi:hypothetical protein
MRICDNCGALDQPAVCKECQQITLRKDEIIAALEAKAALLEALERIVRVDDSQYECVLCGAESACKANCPMPQTRYAIAQARKGNAK